MKSSAPECGTQTKLINFRQQRKLSVSICPATKIKTDYDKKTTKEVKSSYRVPQVLQLPEQPFP